uniref:Uncharacterized protein n=1 Tax=Vitis vinifera TaxID=29760 RepID=F6H4V7_VITVI
MLGIGDLRNQRPKSMQKGRPNHACLNRAFILAVRRVMLGGHSSDPRILTADEIETILRMQLAATHSNDPYMDDYYYQACLAKKSSQARLKHHLCPTHLRELPPRARANIEPHAFLQVDALERVPLSSIRIPRPLLEVDPPKSSVAGPWNRNRCLQQGSPLRMVFVFSLMWMTQIDFYNSISSKMAGPG